MPARPERRARALAAGWVLIATGCAVGPHYLRPPPPPVEGYLPQQTGTASRPPGDAAPRFRPGERPPASWWREFGVPPLDEAVRTALRNGATLDAAVATLRRSEYALRAGYGVFYPQVDLDLTASRQRFSPARFGQVAPGSLFNLFTVSGAVTYVLDAVGGARRRVEGLRAGVEENRALRDAAALTLAGNVVNAMVAGAGYRAEMAALHASIDAARAQQALTEVRVRAGTARESALASLRAQVATLEASLPPLEQKADQSDHLLAMLSGTTPALWAPTVAALEDFRAPQDLPVSLPADLVRRRPDIVAAEARVHGASAALGVATANLFPRITLSGDAGGNATRLGQLGSESARFWSVGADAGIPVFHGGTSWYGRLAAREAYRASLADYRQTVLVAFEQVADVLRALAHDADLVAATDAADRDAGLALSLTRANYDAGLVDYLAVLDATGRSAQARTGHVAALAQRLQDTTALYVALGGGGYAPGEGGGEAR